MAPKKDKPAASPGSATRAGEVKLGEEPLTPAAEAVISARLDEQAEKFASQFAALSSLVTDLAAKFEQSSSTASAVDNSAVDVPLGAPRSDEADTTPANIVDSQSAQPVVDDTGAAPTRAAVVSISEAAQDSVGPPSNRADDSGVPSGDSEETPLDLNSVEAVFLDWTSLKNYIEPGFRAPVAFCKPSPHIYNLAEDHVYRYLKDKDERSAEEYINLHSYGFFLSCSNKALEAAFVEAGRTYGTDSPISKSLQQILSGNACIEKQIRFRLAWFRGTKGPDATRESKVLGQVVRANNFDPSVEEWGSADYADLSAAFREKVLLSQLSAAGKALVPRDGPSRPSPPSKPSQPPKAPKGGGGK